MVNIESFINKINTLIHQEINKMITPRLQEFVRAMRLEGLAIPQSPQNPPPKEGSSDFSLTDQVDSWLINGISYKNGIYQVELSKALSQAGTQDQHAERRIQALTSNDFYTPDYPLFHGIVNTLYQNRESVFKDQIETTKTSLATLINGKWLMALTRIAYNPNRSALITHNYQQADAYQSVVNNFEGPDGDITIQANTQELLNSLLSTSQSPQEISQVYNWFRGKPSFLWRVNSKPKKLSERIAGFGAVSVGSVFDGCGGGPEVSSVSVRVRARKI